jgi:hypothetical protein
LFPTSFAFFVPVAAQEACRRFAARWRKSYPTMVRQLQKDLPELLSFFYFPQPLWHKLRNTNIIERFFVEVRRQTRPMVGFGPDQLFHLPSDSTSTGKIAPSSFLHKRLDIT